jgi:predicted RNA binding protein YcfA (HicA-like mRNA interferase family)
VAERKTLYAEGVPVKVRELIKTLEKAGWRHVRTSGDHRVFRSPDGRITVRRLSNDQEILPCDRWRFDRL